jgi:hypothetical protein
MHPLCWAGKAVSLKATIAEDLQDPIGVREYAKRMIPKVAYNLEQSSGWRSRCVHGLDLGASGGKKNKKEIKVVGDRARATWWLAALAWGVILGLCCWFRHSVMCMAVFHGPGSRGAWWSFGPRTTARVADRNSKALEVTTMQVLLWSVNVAYQIYSFRWWYQ